MAHLLHDLLAVIFVYWAVVLPHELGHLAAGVLVRMRFGEIWVMGVGLTRRRRGWGLSVSLKNRDGGNCMVYPVDSVDLRRRYLIVAAGGPVLGLATSLLYGGLVVCLHMPNNWHHDLIVAAQFGIVLNILSLWPDWPGPIKSDGYRMRILTRVDPASEVHIALITVSRLDKVGWPYEEMDSRFLDVLRNSDLATFHAYYWSLCTARLEEASAILRHWQSLPATVADGRMEGGDRAFIALEQAFFAARYNGDIETARAILATLPASTRLPGMRARAEAAVFLARGDRAGARKAAENGLKLTAVLERDDRNLSRIVLGDLRALHAAAAL